VTDRWDAFFMKLAREAASMSRDPSSQVGAVIACRREIVSMGYNGFPPGIADDERLLDRERKYQLVVHAEMNALLRAGREARGSTIYLHRLPPCSACAKHLVAAGIAEVVACDDPVPARWVQDVSRAIALLGEAQVHFRFVSFGDALKTGT